MHKEKNYLIFIVLLVLYSSTLKAQLFIDDGTNGLIHISNANSGTLGNAESAANNVALFVDGNMTIEGTYNNTAAETQINGNLSNAGTFTSTGDEVFVNGSASSISGSFTSANDFHNLILKSPSSPVEAVNLQNDIEINPNGILKFEGGILSTGSNAVLVKNTATNAIQGTGSNGALDNFILGEVQRNVVAGTTYDFPSGQVSSNSGGGDGLQNLSFKSNTGNGTVVVKFTAGDGDGVASNLAICPSANGTIDYIIDNGSWEVTNPGGEISDYDITLHPTDFTDNGYVDYTIIKDGAPTGLDPCDGSLSTLPITHSGLTSFSVFEVGASTNGGLLPIELLSFEAAAVDRRTKLNWATLSETNNDYFILQKSSTGSYWEDFGRVAGAGTSSSQMNYEYYDHSPFLDGTYYRLKQVDFDGQYSYSDVRFVNFNKGDQDIQIYPNPSSGQVTIKAQTLDLSSVQLYDLLGQSININEMIISRSETQMQLDASKLPEGIYHFHTNSKVIKFSKQ